MKTILIVYHSRSGHTQALAQAIAQGAEGQDTQVKVKKVEETSNDDLLQADAIIIGSPVYFGSMAAPVKELIDRSVTIRGSLKNKIGAAFVTSGHDSGGKETTIMSIIQAMLIHEMIVVGDPISAGGHYGAAAVGEPDHRAINQGKALGARVAELVHQFKEAGAWK
ncbi:MAG: flavodoxin family protein [bacterium]|nr:flavodoxin family protein [bacterium]